MNTKIDFVIPWVNGDDVNWKNEKNNYSNNNSKKATDAQYRDWNILKYWFRAVELYAPWVNKIYFITCGHLPEWLNTGSPKLVVVKHKDYIDKKYLPTFSSHVIELNIHNIQGLEEQFVYFNDDMFINNYVTPEDFFKNGLPCDTAILSALTPSVVGDPFVHYLCNDLSVLNSHFNKKTIIRNNINKWFSLGYERMLFKNIYFSLTKKFTGFYSFHLPSSFLKSTFEHVWKEEYDLLDKTCLNKFRGLNDVNQYVMTYYQYGKGDFIPRKLDFGMFYTLTNNNSRIYYDILNATHKTICINDTINDIDYEKEKSKLIETFEIKFPNKCCYEL